MPADYDPSTSLWESGRAVQFQAVVTAGSAGQAYGTPSGTVTFAVNGAAVSTAPLGTNGQALFTLDDPPAQLDIVTATYSGDAAFATAEAAGSVRVVAPGPAIVVKSAGVPGTAVSGQPARIALGYATGWIYADPTPGRLAVQMCLSADDDFGPSDPVLARAVRPVRSSAVTVQPTLSASRLPAGLAGGDYRLYLRVTDAGGRTNVTTAVGQITVAPALAKLTIAGIVPETATAPATGPRWVRVTLTNAGNVPMDGPVTTDVLAAPAAGSTAGATPMGRTVRRVRVAAGRSTTVLVRLRYPTDLSPGDHPLQLKVSGGGLDDTLDVGASIQVA